MEERNGGPDPALKKGPDEQQYLELISSGNLENSENLRLMAEYLAALIDAAEATKIELYEQYRKPVDLFRAGLRALARQNWWREDRYDILDNDTRERLAGAILKGCRLKVVLAEKYQAVGERIRDYSGKQENEN